jgi:citrate synthase
MVDQPPAPGARWLPAVAAARLLGVQTRSLYAYVSRGLVRSVAAAGQRQRLYAWDDLERLRKRRDARAGHGAVAAAALQFGDAVLDSAITEIHAEAPRYRGFSAVELAARAVPFENVAELLWTGVLCDGAVRWPLDAAATASGARRGGAGARGAGSRAAGSANSAAPTGGASAMFDALQRVALRAAAADPQRDDGRGDAFARCGRLLIPQLAVACNPLSRAADARRAARQSSVAAMVAAAWRVPAAATPAIETALILLADHELNASTFTARVTASTGADPYAVVMAALGALSGPRHGTAGLEVARFLHAVGRPTRAAAAVRELRQRFQLPPGFGHRAYAGVDPRTPPLLALAQRLAGHDPLVRTALALCAAAGEAGALPNVDLGLTALTAALRLPATAATSWYAVARTAGWLAHAAEQRSAGALLRPRARYVGAAPRAVQYQPRR